MAFFCLLLLLLTQINCRRIFVTPISSFFTDAKNAFSEKLYAFREGLSVKNIMAVKNAIVEKLYAVPGMLTVNNIVELRRVEQIRLSVNKANIEELDQAIATVREIQASENLKSLYLIAAYVATAISWLATDTFCDIYGPGYCPLTMERSNGTFTRCAFPGVIVFFGGMAGVEMLSKYLNSNPDVIRIAELKNDDLTFCRSVLCKDDEGFKAFLQEKKVESDLSLAEFRMYYTLYLSSRHGKRLAKPFNPFGASL